MKATAALCMERAECVMGVASQLALVGTTLMMEPASSSKPSVINYQSTRNHMPEHLNFHETDDFIFILSPCMLLSHIFKKPTHALYFKTQSLL
jgi:hypothetical protein